MSGTANNGMDELAILVESFVEEVKPFLAGIRRGVAGIFAMPRDSQAITAARGYLSTISASAQVLDLPAARQLGELAQLLDEAFQSAERGGVPDESRVPMFAMVDHLEEHLDGLLTGDDRGRERLDNAYRLLEQVLQTVEEAEAAPSSNLDISLDDLLLTLQPTALPVADPQDDPALTGEGELAEPAKVETTNLVLLAEEEVAPIEWGEKEAKLWEDRGWDESQAAYGNTGWVFLDDDEETAQVANRGEDALVAEAPTAQAEQPSPELEVAHAAPVDEVIVAPEPVGTASLAELAPDGVNNVLLPMVANSPEPEATASAPAATASLAGIEPEATDKVLLPTVTETASEPVATASLAEFENERSDKVLLPTMPVAAPEPVGTASLADHAPGADKVLLPTAAAGTGSLSIDADGLEEAALLALSPDQVETYFALDSAEQRTYLEARLGEMSDFAAELGLEATEHAGADEVTELIAALPSTGELLGKGAVPVTAQLAHGDDDDHEPLAPSKRRGRKNRRAVLPAASASGETGSLSDSVLHVAPAGDAGESSHAEDAAASEDVASVDDVLLTEYHPNDHGTGVLSADSLEASGRVRVEPRDADPLHEGTDRLLPTDTEDDQLFATADETHGEDKEVFAAELEDEAEGGSFLDALFEEDGAPGMSQAQVSSASDQFFGDEDEGEIDPAYSAMPDVSPEIEAAFARLSDADMSTFLSLDGEAAMAFLQARASGEDAVVAEESVVEAYDAPQLVDVQATADAAEEAALAEADLPDVAIDQEILEVFLLEMQELLAEWVRMAGQLRAMPANGMLIADLRRVAHTVKGAARMVGFHDLGTVGWRVEELLDLLDERDLSAAPAVLDFVDLSYALIERLSADTSLAASAYAPETAELDRLHEQLAEAIKSGELVSSPMDQGEDRLVAASATDDVGDDQYVDDEEISDELLDVFVQEADEHLAAFNRALVALDRNPADTSQIMEAKRVVHTLKGASAALGYPVTAALCHSIEDLFEQLDGSGRQPSREMMTLFFETAETLESLMAGITAGRGENAAQAAPLRARYANFLKGQPIAQDTVVEQVPVAGTGDAQQRTGEVTARSVRVDIAHLDDLLNLVGELVINRTSQEQHLERLGRTVNELLLSVDRLRRVGFQLESRYEVAELLRSEQRPATGGNTGTGSGRLRLLSPQGGEEEEFDALEMDRYTELHRISRELVEIASDVNAAGTEFDSLYDSFDQTLSRQSRIATDLQDRMMEVRLVPISTLAARLYRAVRGVAQRRSRQVEMVIEGEAVEIDKVLLEEITDPLLHLVRNAADHGIESPHDRLTRGKSAGGTIRLIAAREGNEAVIRVSDDGAGIDLDRVLEKAVARGVVRNRSGMTREQILDLIFLPGFSTSASVSDISGRGVGLDVVRTNVRRLKGTIDVESTPGVGTTFTIRLPIMLAVTRALLIRSGAQTFAIPLPVVEQVAFFSKDQVSSVGGGDLLDLGGETYPVVYLSRALGLTDSSETLSSGARALIVGNVDRRIALVVDELVGQQEIVVKQLGRHLQSVAGVAGATILGNGQVVLILNVLDLIGDRRSVRPAARANEVVTPLPQPLRPIGAARGAEGPRVAMIVDDSLSVRRVLTRTLERDGWQVVGAKDGVEALEMLAWANPRVMVLDIEMPRMDGYELTSLIRNHPDYHDLPIAMLTSRAGEKHRRKAFDLGVSAYLVKPFEETDLLRTVRELSMTVRQARDAG